MPNVRRYCRHRYSDSSSFSELSDSSSGSSSFTFDDLMDLEPPQRGPKPLHFSGVSVGDRVEVHGFREENLAILNGMQGNIYMCIKRGYKVKLDQVPEGEESEGMKSRKWHLKPRNLRRVGKQFQL